jgi:hypothetical protein
MKKYKRPSRVVYIDPTTNFPKCNPNICKDKLQEFFEVKETNYKWVGGLVIHKFFYSRCSDCKSITITNLNKQRTNESYKNAIKNNGKDIDII